MHQKSLATFSKDIKVDSASSVISNIVIVQEGLDKCNGFFSRELLDGLIEQGNAQPNGVKSRFGHPNMCKTTLGTFIGRYKNFRPLEDEGIYKVIGDLHLDEITKKTNVEGQGITYFEYISDMAKSNPDMFGNSIVFACDADYPEMEIEGEVGIVERYLLPVSFIASDLVDSPAATDNLFKSSDDLGVIMTQFLDENPGLFDLVQKDDSLIQSFLTRYESYKNKKSNMSLIDKLLGKSKKKDIEQTLGDGSIVTVITEAQEAKVGDKVNDSDGKPLPDGEALLPDGTKWMIAAGAISEIVPVDENQDPPAEEEAKEDPEEVTGLKEMFSKFEKSINGRLGKIEKSISESQKENLGILEEVAGEVLKVKEAHSLLAKSVKSNYKVPGATEKDINPGGEKSFMDRIEEQKEAKKQENK
ncbi:hypothetical protein [Epilithonimonas sp. UC225_85]|uniref:hypothetical protein n=1 Tax=Epilithonimonas sp. UC225_85 TaxID=3350167 RepID=UPI0036D23296